ncbi:MAG: universal stress protein [Chlorobium sp.]|nr:MAG: universal stress protein [Chlorobium sp.]
MKLLVAIDFSELADRVILAAEKLAKTVKAQVFLLHVIPPPSPIIDAPPEVEAFRPSEEIFRNKKFPPSSPLFDFPESTKLTEFAEQLQVSGIDTAIIVEQNDEVTAIIEASEKNGVDMIMLGSHGHGALFHLLIGSVSEGVIRRATCPVIIVPSKKRFR